MVKKSGYIWYIYTYQVDVLIIFRNIQCSDIIYFPVYALDILILNKREHSVI